MKNLFPTKRLFTYFFVSQKDISSKNWNPFFFQSFRPRFMVTQKIKNPTYEYTFQFFSIGCSLIKTRKLVFQTKGIFPTCFSKLLHSNFLPNRFAGATIVLYCAASHLLRKFFFREYVFTNFSWLLPQIQFVSAKFSFLVQHFRIVHARLTYAAMLKSLDFLTIVRRNYTNR